MNDGTPRSLDIERLAKLLALLSSDIDGEVLAAARALGRLLNASGTHVVEVAEMMLARTNRPLKRSHTVRSSGLRRNYHGR
jgi:hypothetical protein